MVDEKQNKPGKEIKAKEPVRQNIPAPKLKKPSKIKKFFREIKVEYKSTTWPNRKVLLSTTAVVAVLLGAMGVYFGLLDYGFSTLTKFLIRILGIG